MPNILYIMICRLYQIDGGLSSISAVLSYLNITLPGQSLSPDAEMGRESLADKVQNLADKLSGSPSRSEEVANDDSVVEQEIYDDVQEMGT